jgi:hypothetical protein
MALDRGRHMMDGVEIDGETGELLEIMAQQVPY